MKWNSENTDLLAPILAQAEDCCLKYNESCINCKNRVICKKMTQASYDMTKIANEEVGNLNSIHWIPSVGYNAQADFGDILSRIDKMDYFLKEHCANTCESCKYKKICELVDDTSLYIHHLAGEIVYSYTDMPVF